MKKAVFFIFFVQTFFLYSQTALMKPAVWVRADSVQLNAEYWYDLSGNGYHLLPQSGLLPDTFARINGHGADRLIKQLFHTVRF